MRWWCGNAARGEFTRGHDVERNAGSTRSIDTIPRDVICRPRDGHRVEALRVPAPRDAPPDTGGPVRLVVTEYPDLDTLRAWEDLVRSTPDTDVAQLPRWARVRATVGYRPLYVLCTRDGTLVGGAQILRRRVPVLGDVGYLSYGPVVRPGCADDELWTALADGLEEVGRRHLRMLFVQPGSDGLAVSERLLARGFRPSAADVAPAVTLRVDLRADEAVLVAAASKHWKMWKNRWPRRGVTVRVGDESDIPLLATLLARSADHHGYEPMTAGYLRCLYRELARDGAVRLLVGEVAGRPVAAQLFTACGDVLKARFIGMDRDSSAASLKVPGALIWSALDWARANGFGWFDWSGLREPTARALLTGQPLDWDVLPGNDRFKVSFGGTVLRYPPAVELISSAPVRRAYDLCRGSHLGRGLLGRTRRVLRGARSGPGDGATRTNP